jgi:P-type Ca2+ transporter type 2C
MITGDIKETAQSIGKDIGIVTENEVAYSSFTGSEFEAKKIEEQRQILSRCVENTSGLLFSRAEPRHKKLLVQELTNLVRAF